MSPSDPLVGHYALLVTAVAHLSSHDSPVEGDGFEPSVPLRNPRADGRLIYKSSRKVRDTHSVGAISDHNLGVFTVTETSTVSCGRWCRVSAPRAEWSTRPSACAINGGFLDFGCITHRGKWPRMPDPSSRPGCRQSARVGRQSYLSHAIPWNILEWLVGIAGPFPRHLQHPFADDVPLDLISTASDRGSRYRH